MMKYFLGPGFSRLNTTTNNDVMSTTVTSTSDREFSSTQKPRNTVQDTNSDEIKPCPGEGPRYGDFKCNHDGTHRVCAQLLDSDTLEPLNWGQSDFWDITQ